MRLRTALTERESMAQLEKYLASTLVLLEYLEEKKNNEHGSLIKKLYGNCLHLLAVKEKEEFKEHDFLLVYRLWVSKLKLRQDRRQNLPQDVEKLAYVIEYVDKVHQKFLPQKIACLLECYCQCFSYQVDPSLLKKLIEKFKEVSQVISSAFGNFKDNKDLLTLKVIAFTKSLEHSKLGQESLVLAFFFCKSVEVSCDKTKTEVSVGETLGHLLGLLESMAFESEVKNVAKNIIRTIIEATTSRTNLWPALKQRNVDDLVPRKSKAGRRYFLKQNKVDEEAASRALAEEHLRMEYNEYQQATPFDVDEIIKQNQLTSQKQNFFKSVQSNLLNKWKVEREIDSSQTKISVVKKVYGHDSKSIKNIEPTSPKQKKSFFNQPTTSREHKRKDSQFYIKTEYRPASARNGFTNNEHRKSISAMRLSRPISKQLDNNTEGSRKRMTSGSSQVYTHRLQGTMRTFGHSEFLLLDSTKGNHSDQFYIK